MNPAVHRLICLPPLLLGLFIGMGGCKILPPAQPVAVDSISDPAASLTQSYRLVPKDRAGAKNGGHATAIAAIKAALETRGMFEAPEGTRPEAWVEFDYGVGNTLPRVDGSRLVEKYLQLSARKSPDTTQAGTRGGEIWNVRTTLATPGSNVGNALPLLAAVAADYIGRDTRAEQIIKVPENSPAVVHVKSVVSGNENPKP